MYTHTVGLKLQPCHALGYSIDRSPLYSTVVEAPDLPGTIGLLNGIHSETNAQNTK